MSGLCDFLHTYGRLRRRIFRNARYYMKWYLALSSPISKKHSTISMPFKVALDQRKVVSDPCISISLTLA